MCHFLFILLLLFTDNFHISRVEQHNIAQFWWFANLFYRLDLYFDYPKIFAKESCPKHLAMIFLRSCKFPSFSGIQILTAVNKKRKWEIDNAIFSFSSKNYVWALLKCWWILSKAWTIPPPSKTMISKYSCKIYKGLTQFKIICLGWKERKHF